MVAAPSTVSVRFLREEDLASADVLFRQAFGSFLGMPEPMQFTGDAAVIRSRFQAFPEAAFGAFQGERLVGSIFGTCWGSFAYLGPLSVDPALWGQGIAQALVARLMECFRAWGVTQVGLYTFPESAKHLALYHKFGFRPRFLTAVLGKALGQGGVEPKPKTWTDLGEGDRARLLVGCRRLAEGIHPGLDLSAEILHLVRRGHGELVWTGAIGEPQAFALCHAGAGSEAGGGTCYVKFAALRSGLGAPDFGNLLKTLEAHARASGVSLLLAGVNTARVGAYELMLKEGYRMHLGGVALHAHEGAGHSHPDAWVLDDWR